MPLQYTVVALASMEDIAGTARATTEIAIAVMENIFGDYEYVELQIHQLFRTCFIRRYTRAVVPAGPPKRVRAWSMRSCAVSRGMMRAEKSRFYEQHNGIHADQHQPS
jgi:hypothetical protein